MARSPRSVVRTIALLAVVTVSLAAAAQTQLRLVSTAWSPFTNEPGRPRFALDLVEAALSRAGITSQTSIVEPARFTPVLLQGDFDGSAAAWMDPERERELVFSQPYLENRLILVGRSGADVSATAFAGLKGKRIAIVGGYSVQRRARQGRTGVRAIERRGGQSPAAAQQRGRLHAHGRAGRELHRRQPCHRSAQPAPVRVAAAADADAALRRETRPHRRAIDRQPLQRAASGDDYGSDLPPSAASGVDSHRRRWRWRPRICAPERSVRAR